jgi:hypothetical protein
LLEQDIPVRALIHKLDARSDADGLLEAVAIFAAAARDAGLELLVNNSEVQKTPNDPAFRDVQHAQLPEFAASVG